MVTLNNTVIGMPQSDTVFSFRTAVLQHRVLFLLHLNLYSSKVVLKWDFIVYLRMRSGSRFVVYILQWLRIVLIYDAVR